MKKLYIAVCVLLSACSSGAQTSVATRIVKDSLFIPWEIVWGPDNNIWLTQKNGYICRLHPTTGVLDTLYHESATVIQGEGGMLGMALHPQFPTTPYVYVAYDYNSGPLYRERVVRYTYNGSNALSAPMVLLDNINASSIHNGCRLLIVADKLYITTGDASTMSTSQNLASPNGKIHRINLDGSIPADNPIPGNSAWSWGHRNPQGIVYANGFLYSSEHGPGSPLEINIIRKGRNYGWPTVHGFCNLPAETQFCSDSNVAQPLIAWTPTLAVCGLDYYSGAMFPGWQGSLLMATLKDAHLYTLQLNAAKDSIVSTAIINAVAYGRLRDICISPAGRIYISTSNSGTSGTGAKIDRIIELYDPTAANVGSAPAVLPMRIHPNPVGDILAGSYTGAEAEYRISTIEGKLVQEGKVQGGSFRIPVIALAAGEYLLQLRTLRQRGEIVVSTFIRK